MSTAKKKLHKGTRFAVVVRRSVHVWINEKKFTPEFMTDFRKQFHPFHTVEQHVEHLAQLYVRGLANDTSFIEGYGQAADMGIAFQLLDGYEEVV